MTLARRCLKRRWITKPPRRASAGESSTENSKEPAFSCLLPETEPLPFARGNSAQFLDQKNIHATLLTTTVRAQTAAPSKKSREKIVLGTAQSHLPKLKLCTTAVRYPIPSSKVKRRKANGGLCRRSGAKTQSGKNFSSGEAMFRKEQIKPQSNQIRRRLIPAPTESVPIGAGNWPRILNPFPSKNGLFRAIPGYSGLFRGGKFSQEPDSEAGIKRPEACQIQDACARCAST